MCYGGQVPTLYRPSFDSEVWAEATCSMRRSRNEGKLVLVVFRLTAREPLGVAVLLVRANQEKGTVRPGDLIYQVFGSRNFD